MGVHNLIVFTLIICVQFIKINSLVAGVDFGGEYFKVALVKPGAPFEIVSNIHSKRKTETMVAFDGEERFYGADAASLEVRRPHSAFCQIRRLLGNSADHPQVVSLTQNEYYPYEIFHNLSRGSAFLKHKDNQHFSAEELVSMVFSHARDLTNAYAKGGVKDWVITTPSFFTQAQRQALLDAAEITGINVLSLIDENVAAALQYGIDRKYDTPYRVLFFNMGSTSLQVAIAEYSTSVIPDRTAGNKTIGVFTIKGKAWDESLGGNQFDLRLASFLADQANSKLGNGIDVRTIPRAIAKIKSQAKKTKIVLSANDQIPISFPGLYKDIDFHTHITRKEFEEMCNDLFLRIEKVVIKAIENADLTIDAIDSVELIGGSVRIPKVAKIVGDLFHGKTLGRHLNGDEAMALGAAFHAANLSAAFRVRNVGMTDISPFQISLHLSDIHASQVDKDTSTINPWTKNAVLFKRNTYLDSRKTVTFKHTKDIVCTLRYDDTNLHLPPGTAAHIASYNITGINNFVEKMKEKNLGDPQITLVFLQDSSNLVHLIHAEALLEEEVEEEVKQKVKATTDGEKEKGTSDKENKEGKIEEEVLEEKVKIKTKKNHLEKLLITRTGLRHEVGLSIVPMSVQDKKDSVARLRELQRLDELRAEKEQAKNSLESTIYSTRDKLSSLENDISKVATERQIKELVTEINEAADWLEGEGDNSEAMEYRMRLRGILGKFDAIMFRLEESTERPKYIKKIERYVKSVRTTIDSWSVDKPHITANETEKCRVLVNNIEEWLETKKNEQTLVEDHEMPVLLSKDMKSRLKELKERIGYISNKPKPLPPQPTKNATETTPGTNETTESPETPSQKENIEEKKEESKPENEQELDSSRDEL